MLVGRLHADTGCTHSPPSRTGSSRSCQTHLTPTRLPLGTCLTEENNLEKQALKHPRNKCRSWTTIHNRGVVYLQNVRCKTLSHLKAHHRYVGRTITSPLHFRLGLSLNRTHPIGTSQRFLTMQRTASFLHTGKPGRTFATGCRGQSPACTTVPSTSTQRQPRAAPATATLCKLSEPSLSFQAAH